MEVRVVSDGSTDETEAIACEFRSQGIHLARIPKSGKAAAINTGIGLATGEILLLTDVRQELDSEGIPRLVECFVDESVRGFPGTPVIRHTTTKCETDIGLYS